MPLQKKWLISRLVAIVDGNLNKVTSILLHLLMCFLSSDCINTSILFTFLAVIWLFTEKQTNHEKNQIKYHCGTVSIC